MPIRGHRQLPPVSIKDATVLILGTGLTMVDYVLSLLRDGYKGPIVAISRRGLLSMAHRRVEPARIDEADIPFGASARRLLRWFRNRIDAHVVEGGDWRSVVDAIRPFTQRLWRELPPASKRNFLEHARAWWMCIVIAWRPRSRRASRRRSRLDVSP